MGLLQKSRKTLCGKEFAWRHFEAYYYSIHGKTKSCSVLRNTNSIRKRLHQLKKLLIVRWRCVEIQIFFRLSLQESWLFCNRQIEWLFCNREIERRSSDQYCIAIANQCCELLHDCAIFWFALSKREEASLGARNPVIKAGFI